MKNTTVTFKNKKTDGEKITMLTAYDYTTAKLEDEAGVDSILVGDSLGMVIMGYDSTLSVTMEDMIHHSKIVARGVGTHSKTTANAPALSTAFASSIFLP